MTNPAPESHDVVIRNNDIKGCRGDGVAVRYGDGVVVEDNDIDAAYVGILIENSSAQEQPIWVRRNVVRRAAAASSSG